MSKPFVDKAGDYNYLRQTLKNTNGKWYNKTIVKFGKIEPNFRIPYVYRGSADDLIKSLNDNTIDLILTDPPYGLTQNKWDIAPDWKGISKEYTRILKDSGQLAIFGTPPNIIEVYNGFKEKFDFRFEVVWDKCRGGMWTTDYAPMKSHENIYVFQKKGVKTKNLTFNKKLIGIKSDPYVIKKAGKSSNYGFDDNNKEIITKSDGVRHPLSVQRIPSVQKFSKEYANFPTQKPVEIMEFFIRGMTEINDIVLDPYLGSGTTAVAAMRNVRMCIGAEIDPISFPIIKKRIMETKKLFDVQWTAENGFLSIKLPNMLEVNA